MIGQPTCILISNVGGGVLQKSIDDFDSGCEGRLGSAVRTQLTLRMDERTTSKSDALYVLPEPKIPCTQRVVWPASTPVRVAKSSPGKCPYGARREAIRALVKCEPRSRRSERSAEWVDKRGARNERGSKIQVNPFRSHTSGQSYGGAIVVEKVPGRMPSCLRCEKAS